MIRKIPKDTDTFHFYNVNPKGKITGDCVIRAIATATGMTWEETLMGLVEMALKHKLSVQATENYDKYLQSLGWVKQKQPRKEDNTKFTGSEFCVQLSVNDKDGKKGNIIAHLGGHHIVCIRPTNSGDGINCRYKVHDTWNSTGGCIGNYWVKP